MQKQLGACAFTASCVMPGPRHRIEGTNRTCCEMHYRMLQASAPAVEENAQFIFRPPRGSRRSSWPTYAGITEAY